MNNITPAPRETYLAVIKSLPGTKIFQALYVTIDERKLINVVENGSLSCAFVVSSVLKMFNLIDNVHGTVAGVVREAPKYGWEITKSPMVGDLVVWPVLEGHPHIGFYLDENTCVSNSSRLGYPAVHGMIMEDGRAPEYFLTNNKL